MELQEQTVDILRLDSDIRVFSLRAKSFPDGIMEAHKALHAVIPNAVERRFFGISRPEKLRGEIIYRAAAEELMPGEDAMPGLETIVLKKGKYVFLLLKDYMKDLHGIDEAFKKLLSTPHLDPEAYCVEWYLSDREVKCMVRLKD